MRKKLLAIFLVAAFSINLIACSNSNEKANPNNTPMPSVSVNETNVDNPNINMEENIYGLKNISIDGLKGSIAQNETFFLFVDYDYSNIKDNVKSNIENSFTQILDENNILCDFYYLDGVSLNEEEISFLKQFSISEDNQDEYCGVYAFKDGSYVNGSFSLNSYETLEETKEKIVSFIFNSLLFEDFHNFATINYEDVLSKIENKEEFILYIGRDSCIDCRAFIPSLKKVVKKYPPSVPMYYLYTQSYKTAINNKEENAQKIWDDLKATLDISGTPSLIYYGKNGEGHKFTGYVSSDYFKMTEEEKKVARDDVSDMLEQWFANNKLSDACASLCD